MKAQRNTGQLLTLLLMVFSSLYAGRTVAQNHPGFSIISSSPTRVVISFTSEKFHLESQLVAGSTVQCIVTQNGITGLDKGFPALPHYAVSLRVPVGKKMAVKVLSAHFFEKRNELIIPSRGAVYRDIRRDTIPFAFGKVYARDAFYPDKLWKTRPAYHLRQAQGQTLVLFPFRFNPVTKTLRIYDKVLLEITFRKGTKARLLQKNHFNTIGFENLFRQHFLNDPSGMKTSPKLHHTPGMLIISYGSFIPLLNDFIQWKRQTGMRVQVADVAAIGTNATDIKAYVRQVYRQSGISYLLLVGDAAQVPSSSLAGNDSDNDYAYVDGDDHYPDLFVGRFSAENATELSTMVRRTLAYEKGSFPDTSWLTRATGIGSAMGTGYHNLTDYQQIRFIDSAYLLATTYRQATELFDGSRGGLDATGNPTAAMLSTALNNGVGIVNYCGHGSTSGWNTTDYDNAKVDSLQNYNKWPFIFSVSCATGNFVHQTCFAEHWLRAAKDGKPAGAVAILMPTITQSWDPPMCGQQRMNALLTAPDSLFPPRTFAAICMEGCMKMNDEYGTEGYKITDTWTVFGDPSLEVRTAVPQKIIANYPSSVDDTCSSVLVKTNLRSGRVALYSKGIIYAVATVNSLGSALLSVDSVPSGREAELTITAFNHLPLSGKIIWQKAAGISVSKENQPGLKIFPNPAREAVTITFTLQRPEQISLTAWSENGQIAAVLYHGSVSSGKHLIRWHPVVSGIYFVELEAEATRVRKKLIFQK